MRVVSISVFSAVLCSPCEALRAESIAGARGNTAQLLPGQRVRFHNDAVKFSLSDARSLYQDQVGIVSSQRDNGKCSVNFFVDNSFEFL